MTSRELAWFTTDDLMVRWDVSRNTVFRRIHAGLPALRGRDGGFRVREDWLLDWENRESQRQVRISA